MALSKKKIVLLEQKASRNAQLVSKAQKTHLNSVKRRIEAKLDEIIVAASAPGSAMIYIKQVELTNLIRSEFAALTTLQKQEIDFLVKKVYNNSRVEIASELGNPFDVTNDFQLKKLVERGTNGTTYSQRLYHNNQVIAERVNSDIGRMLYQNASPQDIKLAITKDFNISYNAADRLIRTETSKFYNSAAEDSYKAAGITKIEWLTEEDDRTCEICGPRDGQVYLIGTMNAPAHVNCRCTILPIIE